MPKRLVVLCLFLTGCTTIQQDAAETAAREPSSYSDISDDEPNAAVRAQAWELTKASFKAGICPELNQVSPNAWKIFSQFWEPSPERKTLPETLAKLMAGTRTQIRELTAEEARGRYAIQTRALAVPGAQSFFLITNARVTTVLAIGPYSQPARCREI